MIGFIKSLFTPKPQIQSVKATGFEDLGLHEDILKAIRSIGYEYPTAIQEQSIPHILTQKDVVASSQTGSGKTAAFVIPILNLFHENPPFKRGVRALILAPTRELAQQSADQVKALSKFVPVRSCAIFGGMAMDPQKQALEQGVDVLCATPGRLLDHIYEGRIDFGCLEVFVLDEADRMLDMGFAPDVERILSLLPTKKQTLVFSATLPEAVMKLIDNICTDPVRVKIGLTTNVPQTMVQKVFPVPDFLKTDLLVHILNKSKAKMTSVIVFTRTKIGAEKLWKSLDKAHLKVVVLHGDRDQKERARALDHFKSGRARILVATDVAARGLDIKGVSHVINYDLPMASEDYIHRIGRTARANADGEAYTLISHAEEARFAEIETVLNKKLPREKVEGFDYKARPQFGSSERHGSGPRRHSGRFQRNRFGGNRSDRDSARPRSGNSHQGHGQQSGRPAQLTDPSADRTISGDRQDQSGRKRHFRRRNRQGSSGNRHQDQRHRGPRNNQNRQPRMYMPQ